MTLQSKGCVVLISLTTEGLIKNNQIPDSTPRRVMAFAAEVNMRCREFASDS